MQDLKKSRVRELFDKSKAKWNYFTNTKVGKVLFSNSFNYAVTVACIAVAASGLFAPVAPLVIATASVAAVGMGINAITETLKIRNLRKLHKENNLLVQHRNAKVQQDIMLSLEPNLNNILGKELYVPSLKNENYGKDKYKIDKNVERAKNTMRVITNNIPGFVGTAAAIAAGASGNVIAILKATGYGVVNSVSLISGSLNEEEKREVKAIFKSNINEEYKKKDTPHYQNLAQLEDYSKKQILQTLALKKLITDENYWTMKDEEKQQKFREIKNNFDLEISNKGLKAFLEKHQVLLDDKKENYAKSFKRTLNPFYENPDKAQEYSSLAHAMNNNSKKQKSRTI
ncbi:MAG TPA: hypothetical protein LFW21_07260 [Rickettsia endosymbiont of Pyrocoelia pectoralis]|nr:hypothetical protein [Rickettsia endosymbiont of Pyrocoelia pectoralis]